MEICIVFGAVDDLRRDTRHFTKFVAMFIAKDEKLEVVRIERRQLRGRVKATCNVHDEQRE